MPTYRYKCLHCEKEFDVQHGINEPKLTACIWEGCPGKVERIPARTSFRLMGGGWAKDRYGK